MTHQADEPVTLSDFTQTPYFMNSALSMHLFLMGSEHV